MIKKSFISHTHIYDGDYNRLTFSDINYNLYYSDYQYRYSVFSDSNYNSTCNFIYRELSAHNGVRLMVVRLRSNVCSIRLTPSQIRYDEIIINLVQNDN